MNPEPPNLFNKSKYRKFFEINSNPIGITFKQLLEFGFDLSDSFILVERKDVPRNNNITIVLEELSQFEYTVNYQNCFAGTMLGDGAFAIVHYYKTHQSAKKILLKHSTSLYDWVQPNLPEDLSFLINDEYLLVTTAHEKKSGIYVCEPSIYEKIMSIEGLEGEMTYATVCKNM